jgi:hypothetical protein
MAHSIDEIYAAIVALSEQIDRIPPTSPERLRLETERERLRSQAAAIASQGRHPKSIELEIEAIEQRLADINALLIKEGYMEKRAGKNIQDPGAYSSSINRILNEQHAEEVKDLTDRLETLRPSQNTRDRDAEGST